MDSFSTPNASTEVHTPPAPAVGFEDSWEPYSPPRKSTRLQQKRQAAANRTPSPHLPSRHYSTQSLGSPRSKAKKNHHLSDMASPPPTSPQKRRAPPSDTSRRVSGTLTAASTATAAAALGLPAPSDTPSRSEPRRVASGAGMAAALGMLPTPAKTPQKPPSEKKRADLDKISRNLFTSHSEDELMPPAKKARGNNFTLDSFAVDEPDDAPIAIFTDSHERVPEVDNSASNPFYGAQSAIPEPAIRRRSKRHTVSIPGEGQVPIEDAVRREDGMLIVFRGKKQFRKFSDNDELNGQSESMDPTDGGLDNAVESRLRRPLDRSAIKPRLLFPTAKNKGEDMDTMMDEDEEAPTDIEDYLLHEAQDDEEELPETPSDEAKDLDTPKAPRFAPVSPPTTQRTTRHGIKSGADATPMKTKGASGKRSPFNDWRVVKGGSSQDHGHKRPGEALTPGSTKRPRA